MKHHVKSIQKGSKVDKYMIQNIKISGMYLGSIFLCALLQKVLKLAVMTETGPEVYVATMTTDK